MVSFNGLTNQANQWEEYFNYLGEGAEISRNDAIVHFMASDG